MCLRTYLYTLDCTTSAIYFLLGTLPRGGSSDHAPSEKLPCQRTRLFRSSATGLHPLFLCVPGPLPYRSGCTHVCVWCAGLWWNHPDYIARSIGLSDVTLFAANVVINGVLGIRIPNFVLGVLGRIVQTVLPLLSPLLNRINPSPAAQAVLTSGFSKLWENIVEKARSG